MIKTKAEATAYAQECDATAVQLLSTACHKIIILLNFNLFYIKIATQN